MSNPGKASPGPWEWDGAESNWFLRDATGTAVMKFDGDNSWTPNEPNAALIAAAPAMASMLRELEWAGSPGGECPECGGQPARDVVDNAYKPKSPKLTRGDFLQAILNGFSNFALWRSRNFRGLPRLPSKGDFGRM